MKSAADGLFLDLRSLSEEEKVFQGEIPAPVFGLEGDRLCAPSSGLRYDVRARVVGKELLVQGALDADFRVLCAKCGEFFSTSVRAPAFLHTYDLTEGVEILDLTPDLREDLLLELPAYPACAEATSGACPNLSLLRPLVQPPPDGDDRENHRWDALDQLKL
jgi:hypothetical protein